jgi:hypothetical protein
MLQHWEENNKSRTAADELAEWTIVLLSVPAVLAQLLYILWCVAGAINLPALH